MFLDHFHIQGLQGCKDPSRRVAPGIRDNPSDSSRRRRSHRVDGLTFLKVAKTAVATARARGRPSRPTRSVPPAGGNLDRGRRTDTGMIVAATVRGWGGTAGDWGGLPQCRPTPVCATAAAPQVLPLSRTSPRDAGPGGSRSAGQWPSAAHLVSTLGPRRGIGQGG